MPRETSGGGTETPFRAKCIKLKTRLTTGDNIYSDIDSRWRGIISRNDFMLLKEENEFVEPYMSNFTADQMLDVLEKLKYSDYIEDTLPQRNFINSVARVRENPDGMDGFYPLDSTGDFTDNYNEVWKFFNVSRLREAIRTKLKTMFSSENVMGNEI